MSSKLKDKQGWSSLEQAGQEIQIWDKTVFKGLKVDEIAREASEI